MDITTVSRPLRHALALDGGGSLHYERVDSATGLKLSIGLIETRSLKSWTSETCAGVCAGFLIGSGITFSLGAHRVIDCTGARSFVVQAQEPWQARHEVQGNCRVQAVFLQFPVSFLDQYQSELPQPGIEGLHDWVPDHRLLAILDQILACPFEGVSRTLYMQGKSLELLATVLDRLNDKTRTSRTTSDLPSSQVARLERAYGLISNNLDKPPGLDELARQVGMCSSLLTAGFRRRFGQSVTECVQDLRLAQAYQDLQSGRMTSSQAAHRIGYSPAYFSTLFKRKYACSPRDVARAHALAVTVADREK